VNRRDIRYNARMRVSRRSLIVGGSATVLALSWRAARGLARPTIVVYKDPT